MYVCVCVCRGAFRLGDEQASEGALKKKKRGERKIVYLVIVQKQRSSAEIKLIQFTVDITVQFFPFILASE